MVARSACAARASLAEPRRLLRASRRSSSSTSRRMVGARSSVPRNAMTALGAPLGLGPGPGLPPWWSRSKTAPNTEPSRSSTSSCARRKWNGFHHCCATAAASRRSCRSSSSRYTASIRYAITIRL
uniref:Uncharacterized protein n=1 Tax=Zea mays TaxID=4577 RepID=C4J889_MAIZE|nr:unknown [Zea mays]